MEWEITGVNIGVNKKPRNFFVKKLLTLLRWGVIDIDVYIVILIVQLVVGSKIAIGRVCVHNVVVYMTEFKGVVLKEGRMYIFGTHGYTQPAHQSGNFDPNQSDNYIYTRDQHMH